MSAVALSSVDSSKTRNSTRAASVVFVSPNDNGKQMPTSALTTSASTSIDSKADNPAPPRDQDTLTLFFRSFFGDACSNKFKSWSY